MREVMTCHRCGAPNDAVTAVDGTVMSPTDGDVSICFSCQSQPAKRAPCGCRFASRGPSFVFVPCSPTCSLYAYVVEECRKLGKPLDLIGPADAR